MEETGTGQDAVECSSCSKPAVYELIGVDEAEGKYCCEVCLGMWFTPEIRRL